MPVLVVVVAEVVPLVLVPVLQMVQEAVAQATLHLARRRVINNGMVTMKADSDFAVATRRPNRIAYQRQVSDKAISISLPLSLCPSDSMKTPLPLVLIIVSLKVNRLFMCPCHTLSSIGKVIKAIINLCFALAKCLLID